MHAVAIDHLERATKHLRLEQSLDALDQIRLAVLSIGEEEGLPIPDEEGCRE